MYCCGVVDVWYHQCCCNVVDVWHHHALPLHSIETSRLVSVVLAPLLSKRAIDIFLLLRSHFWNGTRVPHPVRTSVFLSRWTTAFLNRNVRIPLTPETPTVSRVVFHVAVASFSVKILNRNFFLQATLPVGFARGECFTEKRFSFRFVSRSSLSAPSHQAEWLPSLPSHRSLVYETETRFRGYSGFCMWWLLNYNLKRR